MKQDKRDDLEMRVERLMKSKKIPVHDYYGNRIKIGVVSDTHFGSLFSRYEVLEGAYKVFRREGIEDVYHVGDILDGFGMYRGQIFEQARVGFDEQVKEAVQKIPRHKAITTHFITGTHDLSYFWKNGIHVGEEIQRRRPDLDFLGDEQADILIGGKDKVLMRLIHPGKGSAYALSYNPQKMIDSFTGGEKPQILLIGHYHKAEYLPHYRNVCAVQAGAIVGQTPFMRRNNIAAHVGFWVLQFEVGKHGLANLDAKFFPYFER